MDKWRIFRRVDDEYICFFFYRLTGGEIETSIAVVVFAFFADLFSKNSAASSFVRISSGRVDTEDEDGNDFYNIRKIDQDITHID